MKKLLAILTMSALTVMGHLLFDMYHAECVADTRLSAGATVDLFSYRAHPVLGTAGLEAAPLRVSGTLGAQGQVQVSADLLARSKGGGLYAGAGLFAERLGGSTTTTFEAETTVVTRKHDHGKHKGDKHLHAPKSKVTTRTLATTVRVGGEEFELSPSLVLGVVGRRGAFAEARVVLGGEYGARGQYALGVRF